MSETKDTSSKYTTTEYNRSKRVEDHLKGIYSDCYHFMLPFKDFLDRKMELYKSADYKKLTMYYRGKLAGMDDCLFHELDSFRYDHSGPVMMVSRGPDGRLFGEKDNTWLEENHEYKSSMKVISVWRRSWGTDNLKIWYEGD